MGRKEKKKIWKRTVEVHKMEWLYPYVRLEDFMKVCKELEEENKKLKDRIDELEKCNLNLQEWLDRKEEVNKKLREELSAYDREYFDEDKKAKNIFKEDDTYIYNAKQVRDIC